MKKILKLAGCALMLSGYCASEVAANCPVLTQPDLRRLCRWEGFKILGIKAGTVTVDGTILTNKLGTCGEGDSIKQFVTKKTTTTYPGVLTKDFAEPNNHLKGLCTYTIGGEKIAFDVQLPPKPAESVESRALPPTPLKKPKTFGGVDITMSPEIKQVPLVKPTAPTAPVAQLAQPTKPAPTAKGRPVPPMPHEAPPVPPTRKASDDENSPPAYPPPPPPSRAPQKPVPGVPSRGTQQAAPKAEEEKPVGMSELEEKLQKRKAAQYGTLPPLRHPPEPTYGAG